jgi:heptosyltransferase-1
MPLRAPSRILIVRTSALGDVIHTLPLATALRRQLPATKIGWVVERRFAPLLADSGAIDEVLEVALKDWRRRPFAAGTWRELAAFLARLQAFAAEVVIDTMGNHKGGLLAALTLADRRLGPRRADRREPSSAVWLSEPLALTGRHAVDRTLSLLAGLGLEPGAADFAGPEILPEASCEGPTPPLLIHPGAGWRNKEYPAERWSEVASELTATTGLELGVLSGPGEEALAQRVAAGCSAARLLPAPSLDSLIAHLRRARLLLAGDTGPLHLARALGTEVLCLLGPTDPARNGAYGAPRSNLSHLLPCSFCYQRLGEAKACLLAIEPAAVAHLARRLLAGDPN